MTLILTTTTVDRIGDEKGIFYEYLRGGYGTGGAVLPNQLLPEKKKNKEWKKAVLDALESEALRQYQENLEFKKYRDMISGKLVYTEVTNKDRDFIYDQMLQIKQEADNKEVPSYLRHWDLMYPILSIFSGEILLDEDKFRFDTTDEVSTNEYIREKTARLSKYSELKFKEELNKIMLLQGITPNNNPQSEEEQQRQQQVQQDIIDKFFPATIQSDMSKNWKTSAAQWAEKTWERDFERFRIKNLKYLEVKDYLTTGRCPRHMYVGYNSYYPEYWDPIETFHSKEDDLRDYKDAEYVGRIKYYTASKLIARYGHYFSQKEVELIGESNYNNVVPTEKADSVFETKTVPFRGYSNYQEAFAIQEATGKSFVWEEDLTTGVERPGYLPKIFGQVDNFSRKMNQYLRQDYTPRTDTIPTLECYFRGFKKVGILTYRTEYGDIRTTEINEDIEASVKKELGLKELKTVSQLEYDALPEIKRENTIIWKYVPVMYLGLKVNLSSLHSNLDDFYFVEELKYQIRGDKDSLEDVVAPVVGVIDESPLKKIQSEQMIYNFLLNQNTKYLQKEIGGFFAFDVTMFPSEYMGMSDKSKNALISFRNFVDKTGLMPLDASKHNMMERGGSQFNTMMYQNVSFTDQIRRNIELAQRVKLDAYEKLGITQARIGTPSQYQTTEGIKVGQTASFSQTAGIMHTIMEDQRIKAEIHMAVAQYAQSNGKHPNYIYLASDDEIKFLESIEDEWFDIRRIEVRPLYSAKKKREFETLKQALLQNNTLGHDALTISQIMSSDDFLELTEAARESRMFMVRQQQAQQQHEQQLKDKELQAQQNEQKLRYQMHQENNMTKIEVAKLKALGDIGDDGNNKERATQTVIQEADGRLEKIEADKQIADKKVKKDLDVAAMNLQAKLEKNEIEKRKLDIKEKEIEANKYIATVNYKQ